MMILHFDVEPTKTVLFQCSVRLRLWWVIEKLNVELSWYINSSNYCIFSPGQKVTALACRILTFNIWHLIVLFVSTYCCQILAKAVMTKMWEILVFRGRNGKTLYLYFFLERRSNYAVMKCYWNTKRNVPIIQPINQSINQSGICKVA